MYIVYSLLYFLAVSLLLVPQYLRRPQGHRRRWIREKMGILSDLPVKDGPGPFWVHAVSVGEVAAAIPLLNRLKNLYPERQIILSTMTDTGQSVAAARVPEGTRVMYMPFDSACIMRRFLGRLAPAVFIIVETELWPNVIRIAYGKGIPVIMVNGRISEKSFRGYSMIRVFMKKVLASVSLFLMQTPVDAERIRHLGAAGEKVISSGSFKFDMPALQGVPVWASKLPGPVIVAGSTHAGEEALMIAALRQNLLETPGLRLVLAPRHPERFREVEALVRSSGLRYIKRTGIPEAGMQEGLDENIIILDSIGELSTVYGIADIAVIGKSFLAEGGQNPLEPAMWGKAIICGPHMENFPFINEFYLAGAAFEVTSGGLAEKIRELLADPRKARIAGERAREIYSKNAGAVERSARLVSRYLR